MKEFVVEIREVERHQLKRPFVENCLDDKSLEPLMKSLKEHGQQVPVTVVVGETQDSWTLIDGMRRWKALGLCEEDMILVEIWQCDVATGLLRVLARESNRKREPLEEARLIQELVDQGTSKAVIGRSLGRSVSWVSRRLKLLAGIRVEWWEGLREGWLRPWALARVVMPLARANKKHAEQLTAALKKEPLSTRDLSTWFALYEKALKPKRENMVAAPHLFLDALVVAEHKKKAKQLAGGLEGECLEDVQALCAASDRLAKNLAGLLVGAAPGALESLKNHMEKTCAVLESLIQQIPRRDDEYKSRTNTLDQGSQRQEPLDPKNCGDTESLEKHGEESAAGSGHVAPGGQDDPSFGLDTGAVRHLRGKCGSDTGTPGREAPDRNRLQHADTSYPRGSPASAQKAGG